MKAKVLKSMPEEHPSYGCVGVSRMESAKGKTLFGSSIKHTNYIRLRICHATKSRNFYEDRHQMDKSIVEVDLSPVQFAEMITSAGIGNGVPCTIARLNNELVPDPVFDSKREQFVNDFRDHTDDLAARFEDLISEMEEMSEKGSVGKKERQEFLHRLKLLKQAVQCDTPFIASQFNEQMDKTVHEAKGEVEAHISNLIQQTGLESLKKGQISLE